jgi:hypothetical protein
MLEGSGSLEAHDGMLMGPAAPAREAYHLGVTSRYLAFGGSRSDATAPHCQTAVASRYIASYQVFR